MVGSSASSPEFLAETNDPCLAQRVSIAFIVIDTFFLFLFYVSRHFNPKAVGRPMLVCNTLSYVFCMGSAVTGICGAGHHVGSVPVTTYQTWLKLSKVLEFTYTPAVMFSKLAAIFLYHQVFEVTSYRCVIIFIGILIILQGAISLILAFSICRPFEYFWTQAVDVSSGTCGDVMLFYKSYSIPSLVTDVAMLMLPWPILLKLQMPTAEKVGLMLTFLAGSLGIITCVLRFVVFFTVPLFSDPTWYASGGPTIYALVEPSIYMIASILPTARHLYRRLSRKARATTQSRSTKSDPGVRNGSGLCRSTELETIGKSNTSSRGNKKPLDRWQINTSSSQDELTPGNWESQHEPGLSRPADTASAKTAESHFSASDGIVSDSAPVKHSEEP